MKQVFFEGRLNGWELHSLYKELLSYPPEGYKFIVPNDRQEVGSQNALHSLNKYFVASNWTKSLYDFFRPLAYYFYKLSHDRTPVTDYNLIYASQHIVMKKKPWVVDLEHAGSLVVYGRTLVLKKYIEYYLNSKYCKKILPWSEMGKKTLMASFNCKKIEEKIEVVNLAVHPKIFTKKFDKPKITLLFVGTANRVNIGDSFAIKGGNEVFKAFELLKPHYPNLELVVRSSVPHEIKKKFGNFDGIRILDMFLSWEQLDAEFKNADIFLFPGHSTPGMAILDAMSYELPVVATNVWGNYELVTPGKTGFLINPSSKVQYYDGYYMPQWGNPQFMKDIRHPDIVSINELVEKIKILIENEHLRRKMGATGRFEVEKGKFSIYVRNQKLARIFDEATA